MVDWFSFFIQNPAHCMTFITLFSFFSIPVLLYWRREVFVDLFRDIDGFVVVLLVFAIVFSFFVRIQFDKFHASDEEWEELLFAKELLKGRQGVFNANRYGLGYPLILALGFTFFGFNTSVAWWVNIIFLILSSLLIFIITKLIFDNDSVALFSTFIYLLTPSILYFAGIRMGHPGAVSFFLLLFTLAALLAFQRHEFSFYILSITAIAFSAQTKPEFLFLIVPFLVLFLAFKEYKFLSWKKIGVLVILAIILFFPVFVKSHQTSRSVQGTDWCGHPSQTFHSGKQWDYSLPVITQLDPLLKTVLNNRFSFNYFVYDLPTFFNYWSSGVYRFVVPFVLLGLVWGLWKEKYRRATLLVLFTFLALSFVYLADCAFYESRFAVALYTLLVVYSGFGVYLCSSVLNRFKFGKFISVLLPLTVLTLILFNFQTKYTEWRNNYKILPKYNVEETLRKSVSRIPKRGTLIFTVHRNERMLLEFWGYDALNITSFISSNPDKAFNQSQSISSFKLPVRDDRDNYYIRSWYCEVLPKVKQTCARVEDKYLEKRLYGYKDKTVWKLKIPKDK